MKIWISPRTAFNVTEDGKTTVAIGAIDDATGKTLDAERLIYLLNYEATNRDKGNQSENPEAKEYGEYGVESAAFFNFFRFDSFGEGEGLLWSEYNSKYASATLTDSVCM